MTDYGGGRQQRVRLLIDAAVETDATKIEFELDETNFIGSSLPAIKTFGLDTGDIVKIYEQVNGEWQLGASLDSDDPSTTIAAVGRYAVDITMVSVGPASVELHSARAA